MTMGVQRRTLPIRRLAAAPAAREGGDQVWMTLAGALRAVASVEDGGADRVLGGGATQGDIDAAIAALINGAPAGGDTLGELHGRIAVVEALGSLATDAELVAQVAALLGSATGAGDTLGELEALISLRLLKSANLSDLANASTALTNLGVSAFAKTLLDDADAAAARDTLGIVAAPPAAKIYAAQNFR